MRAPLAGCLIAIFVVGCAGPASKVGYRHAVFRTISRQGIENWRGYAENHGTAFVIDGRGLLITCRHNLLRGVGSMVALEGTGARYTAEVLETHEELDLALLRVREAGRWRSLPLSDREMQQSDWIGVVGYPRNRPEHDDPTVCSGRVVRQLDEQEVGDPTEPRRYHALLETDALVTDGCSGGPMIDAEGNVVGILALARGKTGAMGRGYGLQMARILPVVQEWLVRYRFLADREAAE